MNNPEWIAYQGWVGRPALQYPNLDLWSIFAEKKANILSQGARFVFYKDTPPELQAFLSKVNLPQLLSNCIQQASMNGYAIIDIERIATPEGNVESFIYTNPFCSVYDNFRFDTADNKVNMVCFEVCTTHQRFMTPQYTLFGKTWNKMSRMGLQGSQAPFMVGAVGSLSVVNTAYEYFMDNTNLDKTIKLDELRTLKGDKVYPFLSQNYTPFYVFRNKRFTLGFANMQMNSDVWYLRGIAPLISSMVERIYQEQEMNITRVISNNDPMSMSQTKDSNFTQISKNEQQLLNTTKSFATQRGFQFTIGDGQSINQFPSTYNGTTETQGLKDLLDLCFKWAYGFDLFGESATRESTATENLQRSVAERENLITLTNWYAEQIKDALKSYVFFEFGNDYGTYFDIQIDNQRGSVSPVESANIIQLFQSGLMTMEQAVRKLNPNMSERQVKIEMESLEQQQEQQQQEQQLANSLQQPEQTSSMELENQNE